MHIKDNFFLAIVIPMPFWASALILWITDFVDEGKEINDDRDI